MPGDNALRTRLGFGTPLGALDSVPGRCGAHYILGQCPEIMRYEPVRHRTPLGALHSELRQLKSLPLGEGGFPIAFAKAIGKTDEGKTAETFDKLWKANIPVAIPHPASLHSATLPRGEGFIPSPWRPASIPSRTDLPNLAAPRLLRPPEALPSISAPRPSPSGCPSAGPGSPER